jgi:hypothetical protein
MPLRTQLLALGLIVPGLCTAHRARSDTIIQGQAQTNQGPQIIRIGVDDAGLVILSPLSPQPTISLGDAGITVAVPNPLGTVTLAGGDAGPQPAYIMGGDGGLPARPTVAEFPGYICCGTTPTAIPYTKGCTSGVNRGPNGVALFVDGGSDNSADGILAGTPDPTLSPGGQYGFCSIGVPYLCQTYVTAQVDGGCLTLVGASQ